MWLVTTIGFFSATISNVDGSVQIRARDRQDLENLKEKYAPELSDIIETYTADYPFRALCTREEFPSILARIGADVDYSNFKDEVYKKQGEKRARLYGDVWTTLLALETKETAQKRAKVNGVLDVTAPELLIGDKTEWGIVASIVSTRGNVSTTVTFEDGSTKTFNKFERIIVL